MTKHVVPPRGRGDNSRIGFHGFGKVIFRKRQGYVSLGQAHHVTRDGRTTTLQVWRTACADCGAPFTFKTTANPRGLSRRCASHAAPGRRVRAETGRQRPPSVLD